MMKGYLLILRPDHPLANGQGYVLEHRLVAYEAGLLTDPACHVHHKDGDKLNNVLRNLEVLTASDHHREHSDGGGPAWQRAKTHCPQGHPYDTENTFWRNDGNGRKCRACMREQARRRNAKRRAIRLARQAPAL